MVIGCFSCSSFILRVVGYCKYINLFYINNRYIFKKNIVFLSPDIIKMIQRIQSVYLFLAAVLSGGLIFILDLWVNEQGNRFQVMDSFNSGNALLVIMAVLFFISALITFIAIFQFRNRKMQFVLGRLTILINFFLIGILVYFAQNLSGEIYVSEKGIGLLIPIISIVLVVLANKAIKKDEELVKSVDRLR